MKICVKTLVGWSRAATERAVLEDAMRMQARQRILKLPRNPSQINVPHGGFRNNFDSRLNIGIP